MFKGSFPALYTFFKDKGRKIDYSKSYQLIDFLIGKGANGFYVCGTTGAAPRLSTAERAEMGRKITKYVNGRIPVMIQCGTTSTEESVYLAKEAKKCGADAVSCSTAYYFKYEEANLEEFFTKVARSISPTPMFLYNLPQNTNNDVSVKLVKKLLSHENNIIGIKNSASDIKLTENYIKIDDRFTVMNGSDPYLLQALKLGAKGAVSSTANFLPELFSDAFASFNAGDLKSAEKAQKDITYAVKKLNQYAPLSFYLEIFKYRGIYGKDVRSPFLKLKTKEKKPVVELIKYLRKNTEVKI